MLALGPPVCKYLWSRIIICVFRGTSGPAARSGNLWLAQGTNAEQVRWLFCGGFDGLSVTKVGFELRPSSHFRGCQSAGYSTASCKNEPAGDFFYYYYLFRACDLTESREVVGDTVVV